MMKAAESIQNTEDTNGIAECLDYMALLAALNFSQKLTVHTKNVEINALATGLNMLAEELQFSVVTRAQLAKERDLADGLIETAPVIVLLLDNAGTILRYNSFMENLSGFKLAEVLHKDWMSTFLVPEETKCVENAFKKAINESSASCHTNHILTKDGRKIPIEWHNKIMKDGDDKVIGLLCIGRDISEHIMAEKEKEEMQTQLIQADKLSSLGELSAGVAHEMKQPLNSMKIINQSLLRDIEKNRLDERKLKQNLTDVVQQINKMAEIIDHMRIFTRKTIAGAGKNINVNDAIESVSHFFTGQFNESSIAFVKTLAADLPLVAQDSIRLEQVLLNLLTNARHALAEAKKENKKVEIVSYLEKNSEELVGKDAVVIEVRDNGGGIPPELERKVFEAFFTTKESGKGTGLGLSISSKIIKEGGGVFLLKNSFGEGATFKICFPPAGV